MCPVGWFGVHFGFSGGDMEKIMQTVANISTVLDEIAPCKLAADWDNVGLLIGDKTRQIKGLMLCIDLTEAVLEEAIAAGANMIMAYHPPIFNKISTLTPDSIVFKAIEAGVAVYSMHTALDCAVGGTNDTLAELIGLEKLAPLDRATGQNRVKIVTFASTANTSEIMEAGFRNGAGVIGDYVDCSFVAHGIGTFCGGEYSSPAIGEPGMHEAVEESRIEMVCDEAVAPAVVDAISRAHDYEEPSIDVIKLVDMNVNIGMGRIGELAKSASLDDILKKLKENAGLAGAMVADVGHKKHSKVAVGVGACGGFWKNAKAQGATLFITGEMRHHDALAAKAAGVSVICMGHSNSERPTLPVLADRVKAEFPMMEISVSQNDADPFEIKSI